MKELIPGRGEQTTRKRLRQLEEKAGTLPVIFALLFTESIKILVSGLPVPLIPETAWFHFIGEALKFVMMATAVAAAYIYEDERREYTKKAKETASETKEKVKDKAKEAKDGDKSDS